MGRLAEGRPVRQLGLKVDPELVGRLEGGARRAPRVEAVMVDSPLPRDSEHAPPPVRRHGRVAGEREDAGVVLAAQERRAAVDPELRPARGELAHAEADGRLVGDGARREAPLEGHLQRVERGRELVPGAHVRAQGVLGLHVGDAAPGRERGPFRRAARPAARGRAHGEDERAAGARRVGSADPRADAQAAAGGVGVHLHVVDPHQVGHPQANLADDPVPVGLRVFAHLVRVADRRETRVVDADREAVAPGRERGQRVLVRRDERVPLAEARAVEEGVRRLRALEHEHDPLRVPLGRHDEVALVPRRAQVRVRAREPLRLPRRVRRALPVLVRGPGEADRVVERPVRPALALAGAGRVEREAPLPREAHPPTAGVRGRRRSPRAGRSARAGRQHGAGQREEKCGKPHTVYVEADVVPPRPVQLVWKNWPRGLSVRSYVCAPK